MLLRYAFITSLFLYYGQVLSQRYPFINYTPVDGLVNNGVRLMRQDSRGRLFFLTKAGLSIYDGSRFTNYTTDDGLAQEMVNDVLEITPDSFWVATNISRLNCLVHQQIKTIHTADGFCPVINRFFTTTGGRIYAAADDGLFKWEKNRFVKVPVMFQDEPAEYIADIKEAGRFLLLLLNPGLGPDPGAIYLYDPVNQRTLCKYNDVTTSQWLTDPSGDIWLSAVDGIKRLRKEDLEQGIFRKQPLPMEFSPIQNERPACFTFDKLGRLWMGITGVGLRLFQPGKPAIEYNEASGLASGRINFIFHDREGNNWFLPEGNGVQKLVSTNIVLINHPFGESTICDLFAQPTSDSIWACVAYSNKLILNNNNSKKIFDIGYQPSSPTRVVVKGSHVFIYDQRLLRHYELPANGNTLKKICEYQYSLMEPSTATVDANGNVLFCLGNTLRVFFKDCTTFHFPVHYFIDRPVFDSRGVLWIVTRSGKMSTLTLHPEDPSHYLQLQNDFSSQLKIDNPRSLLIDQEDRIWIGTRFNGLYCYNFQENQLKLLYHADTKNGLSDNFINYLECYHGIVWASSPAGLDKVSIVNKQLLVENLTESNKVYAALRKIVFDRSGNVWAMGESGNVVRIEEGPRAVETQAPHFFLSSIRAGDQIYSGNDSIGPLSYRQNNISFYAAAPSYYDEKEIQYRYRLEGSGNPRWSEPVKDATFHFVNLIPGNYVLHIKADFPARRYSAQFIRYRFIVNPPWWQTWWFRGILALALSAALVATIRRYYQSKLSKQKMLLEKQQAVEKERTRIATDMHDDLGAGLSRIKYLSESIQFKNADHESLLGDVQKIAAYSDEMVEKMGEIVWALNEKNDSLDHLVAFTRSYASDYLSTNNINCIFKLVEVLPQSFVTGEVRRNIFLSVKETLHNVVKHADATTVTITITTEPNFKISIQDDGVGIDWKHIRQFSNGLSNISKRMEEIGGKAAFQNSDGTEVILDVPLKR